MNYTKPRPVQTAFDVLYAEIVERKRLRDEKRKPKKAPPPEGARTFGYFRVSTHQQATSGYSLDGQKAQIEKYAREKGLGEVHYFVDPGVSASKVPLADRKAGRRLVETVRPGDRVIIPKIDRGFRNFADFIHWHDRWSEMGVKLHVINFYGMGNIDASTASGRLVARMVAAFAAHESEMISERTREAFAAKRAQGYLWNAYAPPGFKAKKTPRGYVAVPDPVARKLMGQMLAWFEEGQSHQAIADHLTLHNVPPLGRKQKGWNEVRVLRYCQAEKQLQDIERVAQHAAPETGVDGE